MEMSEYEKNNERLRAIHLKTVKAAQKLESDKSKFIDDLETIKYSDLLIIKAAFVKEKNEIAERLKKEPRKHSILRELQLARFKILAVEYRIEELQREAAYSGYGFIGK